MIRAQLQHVLSLSASRLRNCSCIWVMLAICTFSWTGWAQPIPAFDMPAENHIAAGYIKLVWKLDGASEGTQRPAFELQESSSHSFESSKTIYEGPDFATYISGLPDGEYYYRVRVKTTPDLPANSWSSAVAVFVEHQSLQLAIWLFVLGGSVFLATVALIIYGARTS